MGATPCGWARAESRHRPGRHHDQPRLFVQLVAASQSGCDVFLCSDVQLLEAARGSSLTVIDLNDVP